jgi:hypothetical protein
VTALFASRLPDFYIPGVQTWDERRRNVEHSMSLGLPRLTVRDEKPGHLTIACYGPSLRDTYRDMSGPVLSVSGAHDFLTERRVIPEYHVECDPRSHKAQMLTRPNADTEYLIASCCHPDVFRALDGCKVLLWHLDNGPESRMWATQHDPLALCISGGSTVGLRAFEITHVLGYRSIDVHGMDCSFDGLNQWAGKHSGERKSVHYVTMPDSKRRYATTPLMVQQAREAVTFWRTHDVPMKFRGSGLCQAMWKHSKDGK